MSKDDQLYNRTEYVTDRLLISSSSIYEYDIRQANINMMYAYGLLEEQRYKELQVVDKIVREKYVGLVEKKDNDTGKPKYTFNIIQNGIKTAKRLLLETNVIEDDEIVRIANDAVYVNRAVPLKYTRFDLNNNGRFVEFINKGHFTSMLSLPSSVVVFFAISSNDDYIVDVKGINENLLESHQAFLSFICDMLMMKERVDTGTMMRRFNEFYTLYINKQLPIEYYREFRSNSSYRLTIQQYGPFDLSPQIDADLRYVDISYNLYILRVLYAELLRST